jgi:putative transposase
MVMDRFAYSERRACELLGQHRSTQRYRPKHRDGDQDLRRELRTISERKPRWGYRRAHGHLREHGHHLNRKRVQRIWREEGLRVPERKRKRARRGTSDVPGDRLGAECPDHVWALDFQFDSTADGRMLKLLNVVDEFTREALACEVERRVTADEVVAVLERLIAARGQAPQFIRCDNGPELTADALRVWCEARSAGTSFIEPGSPWQNPYVESFNARLRDEVLDTELFYDLAEAKVIVADWRAAYNREHPHSALAMRSPATFAAAWRAEQAA